MKLLGNLVLVLGLIFGTSVIGHPLQHQNQVLLISFDGFRWDYLDKTDTPNFDKLMRQGVKVHQVTNAFATLTMPNHYTLVTGLYEEDHGIIANTFYDPTYEASYSFNTETKWYNMTEPIWITAERENIRAGSYMWVGNQAVFNGIKPTKVQPYRSNTDHTKAVDTVLNWLSNDRIQLATLYMNEPDSTGHKYGPNSPQLRDKIKELDKLVGHLIDGLRKRSLTSKVNAIIASDHGMTDTSNDKSINLADFVDFKNDVKWSYASAVGLILPQTDKTEKVYKTLKRAAQNNLHFKVYKKEDIPAELHYKHNRRIPPIVVIPENGWLLKKGSYKLTVNGNHGFSNQESDMKTMMIARGPDFKCNYRQNDMNSVDLYPLMCHILGLKSCHQSHGKLENTVNMLNSGENLCLIDDNIQG